MANAIFDALMNGNAQQHYAQQQAHQAQTLIHERTQEHTNKAFNHGIQQAISPPNRPPITNVMTLASRARELFLQRMGGIRAAMVVAPNDFIQCHIANDMVYVFFCLSGKEGVTKEQIDLFPSDTLITQFRMILA